MWIVVDGGAVLLAIPLELGSHRLAGQLSCAPGVLIIIVLLE